MPVTKGPANSGGRAVASWGGPSLSRAWSLLFQPDDAPPCDGDSGPSSSDSSPSGTLVLRPSPELASVLDEFTQAWERGEAPLVERYLGLLDPADCRGAVELIYREFCLAEASGRRPELSQYVSRFPGHAEALERLLGLHGACSPSLLGRWVESASGDRDLPKVGDSIGPYVLRRELGRGGFARVFLAEQSNLENRLVVVKLTTRPTREPWLLARVRHAHIVEIVSHDLVNDGAFQFQLICMPFWGGATLAAVLTARRQRQHHPVSGRDLLADLDAVAASGYPAVNPARPAREILAVLSYDQAVAWVGARLAEALDHAFSRDVAHGDVKPSNVLLSADGNPMLLDFNLARDGSPAGSSGLAHDPGGTLAYMAPERLRALAVSGPAGDGSDSRRSRASLGLDPSGDASADASQGRDPLDYAAHHADIYALGMVLLETATGRPPEQGVSPVDPAPDSRQSPLGAAASVWAAAHGRSAGTLIRESESAGGRAIAPGLRAILERCLDPDPARRYRRAWELAEDLDRWRTNRPLVFTVEPFWGQTVPRWLRRHRRRLVLIAAALSLIVGLPLTSVVLFRSLSNLQDSARYKLARLWDDPEARAYDFQRPPAIRLLKADDSHVEAAARALKEYGVLGPDDWRQRDDVRCLPQAEREDLELWLMGQQAYLYCHALENRPGSPEDWRRALKILDDLSGSSPVPVLAAMRLRLGAKLGAKPSSSPPVSTRSPVPRATPWVNEYLLGVVAECESESEPPYAPQAADGPKNLRSNRAVKDREDLDRTRRAAERALKRYNNLLAVHPHSYWGHYRAAATAFGLGSIAVRPASTTYFAEAAGHLEQCLKRRPGNPTLQGQLATCLWELNQNREALAEIEKAIEGAPDLAELYRTRAFIRTTLGEAIGLGLIEDLQHFEILSHFLPWAFLGETPASPDQLSWSRTQYQSRFRASLDLGTLVSNHPTELDGHGKKVEVDPEELTVRAVLASRIRDAGEFDLAAIEFGKILILEPDQIEVRMSQAILSIETRRFEAAHREFDAVLTNPGLIEHVQKEPKFIRRFHHASRQYCLNGKFQEGRAIARRALDLAITLRLPRGESHYNMARAYALSARTDPQFIADAADQLYRVFVANPVNHRIYTMDPAFEPVRYQLDAELRKKPDPTEEYRRRLCLLLAQAH
ncbi:MAG: protein kinase [Isosphaerales bacterium]